MAIGAIIGGAAAGGATSALLQPAMEILLQREYAALTPKIASPFELPQMLRRGSISEGQYYEFMARNGFDSQRASELLVLSEQFLSPLDYAVLWRRGVIADRDFHDLLKHIGLADYSIQHLKKLTEYFPGPADLIHFAVREVYSPDIRGKFGMDEDFPSRFAEEAEKIGVSREMAGNYWASHWELISVTQAFEMYHRRAGSIDKGLISREELDTLLRAKDIMPFWRDKLVEISHAPFTRVDVRRMYSMGEMSEEEVVSAYMDIGYDRARAEKLKNFTVREYSADLAGVTKSRVVSSYVRRIISREQAAEMLKQLGISPTGIEFELQLADYDIAEQEFEMLRADIESRYEMGDITIDDARNILQGANAPVPFIESTILKLQARVARKRKMPSRSDLTRWFENDIIDEGGYYEWMGRIGYSQEIIRLYMTEIMISGGAKKRKFLSIPAYKGWLKKGIINELEWRSIAAEMGVSQSDTERVLQEVGKSGG